MDTALNLPLPTAGLSPSVSPVERAITTKVQAVEEPDRPATLPANRPFVAQAVSARLSGDDVPAAPAEIAPPERTLRPYDVPMLPYDAAEEPVGAPSADTGPADDSAAETA